MDAPRISLRRAEAAAQPGSLVAERYHVVAPLGRPEMGPALIAVDRSRADQLVILRLARAGCDVEPSELLAEFAVFRNLRHPNLVRIRGLELEPANQQAFLVLEMVDGPALPDVLRHQSFHRITQALAESCRALTAIHSHGWVLGDLHREDLRLSSQGRVMLSRIARPGRIGHHAPPTSPSAYAAPERMAGDHPLDPRMDFYSLGALFHEILTGRLPEEPRLATDPLPPENLSRKLRDLWPLITRLLAADPERRISSGPELLAALEEATGDRHPLETPESREEAIRSKPLAERLRELSMIQERLDEADRLESLHLVVLRGSPGSGRRGLLQEVQTRAAIQGCRTVAARGWAGAGPFHLLARLLEPLQPELPSTGELGEWEVELLNHVLEPRPWPEWPEHESDHPPPQISALARLTARILRIASRSRPLLLALHDLDQADPASLEVLEALIRLAPSTRTLLVATAHEQRSDDPLGQWLHRIDRPRRTLMTLAPLTDEELATRIGEVLSAPAPEPELAMTLNQGFRGRVRLIQEHLIRQARTGPLWTDEDGWRLEPSPQELPGPVPAPPGGAWYRQLPDSQRSLLAALSILEVPTSSAVLSTALGLNSLQLERALGGLARRGLHRLLPDDSDCILPLEEPFRGWIMAGVAWNRAAVLALELARAMEQEDPESNSPVATTRLYLRSSDPVSAFRWAMSSARWCRGRGDLTQAVELVQRACSLSGHVPAEEAAAALRPMETMLFHLGRISEAEAIQRRLEHLSDTPGEWADLLARRALTQGRQGDLDGMLASIQEGLALLETPGLEQARLHRLLGVHCLRVGQPGNALESLREAEAILAELPLDREAHQERAAQLSLEASAYYQQGMMEAARGTLEEAIRLAEAHGDQAALVMRSGNLALVMEHCGEISRARRIIQEALERARRIGMADAEGNLNFNLARLDLTEGRVREARRNFQAYLQLAAGADDDTRLLRGRLALAQTEYWAGRLEEARRILNQVEQATRDHPTPLFQEDLLSVEALILEDQGLYREARDRLERLEQSQEGSGRLLPGQETRLRQAELAHRAGDRSAASRILRELSADLAEDHDSSVRGRVLLLRAELIGRTAPGESRRLLDEALQEIETTNLADEGPQLRAALGLAALGQRALEPARRQATWLAQRAPFRLSLGTRIDLLRLQAGLADPAAGRRYLTSALSLTEEAGFRSRLVAIHRSRAELELTAGRPAAGLRALARAEQILGTLGGGAHRSAGDQRRRLEELRKTLLRKLLELDQDAQERLRQLPLLQGGPVHQVPVPDWSDLVRQAAMELKEILQAERLILMLADDPDPIPILTLDSGQLPLAEAPSHLLQQAQTDQTIHREADGAVLPLQPLPGDLPLGAIWVQGLPEKPDRLDQDPVPALLLRIAMGVCGTVLAWRSVRSNEQLATLQELAVQEVDGQTDGLLDWLLREALALLEADRGIVLLGAEPGLWSPRGARDRAGSIPVEKLELPLDRLKRIARSGRSALVMEEGLESSPGRSLLAIPLMDGTRPLGLLCLEKRPPASRPFQASDRQVADLLGRLASARLEAMQHQRAHRSVQFRLQELERMKARFTDLVTHELSTPLSSAMGYLELLKSDLASILDPVRADYLHQAGAALDKLTSTVRSVTDLARLDGERPRGRVEIVDLREIIRRVAGDLQPLITHRRQKLRIALPPEPPRVSVVQQEIDRALRNLVLNAIRFTPDQGSITIELGSRKGRAEIHVQDSGIGIPAEERSRIFQSFYESGDLMQHFSGTTEFRSGGLGLGLAVAQAAVERNHGRLSVESTPGQGSRFTISLPLQA